MRLANTANVAIFKAPLAVNTDGAPTSYHPEDYKGERLAINHLDNGIVIRASSGAPLTMAQRIEIFEQWRGSLDWKVPDGYRITWQNVIAAKDGKPCIFKLDNAGYFGSLTSLQNGLSGDAAGECEVKNQIDQRYCCATIRMRTRDNQDENARQIHCFARSAGRHQSDEGVGRVGRRPSSGD